MNKKYIKSLFIFRRDLRTHDNTGLIKALHESELVIPCFIFDPAQVGKENNYKSMNAIQFIIESLRDLDQQLKKKNGKLYLFYGHPADVIQDLITAHNIDALFCNRDYTPFSIRRDEQTQKVCLRHQCTFEQLHDLLLHEPEDVLTGNGTPYSIFTAFYKKAITAPIKQTHNIPAGTFYTQAIKEAHSAAALFKKILKGYNNKKIHVCGGSAHAVALLKKIGKLKNYSRTHDIPALPTSNLSAHLKFGTISIRHAYQTIAATLGSCHPLLRQLYWRDFFTHVAYRSPFVFWPTISCKISKFALEK